MSAPPSSSPRRSTSPIARPSSRARASRRRWRRSIRRRRSPLPEESDDHRRLLGLVLRFDVDHDDSAFKRLLKGGLEAVANLVRLLDAHAAGHHEMEVDEDGPAGMAR